MLLRPRPPADLPGMVGAVSDQPFRPAPELLDWIRATFLDDGSPLFNEEHAHLEQAAIGVLWCSVPRSSGGNAVVGQAERLQFQGNKWSQERQAQQMVGWFGCLPAFVLTFQTDYADAVDDATFCALVEHELYHCGQALDAFGAPKFRKDGSPAFCIRGHDVEEFVGIVRRYGAGSAAGQTQALVKAAATPPSVAAADIAGCCGTCGRGLTLMTS